MKLDDSVSWGGWLGVCFFFLLKHPNQNDTAISWVKRQSVWGKIQAALRHSDMKSIEMAGHNH